MCTDGRTFELTPRVLDLGFAYVSSLQLPDIAQPFMEALSNRVHESVSASVLDGSQIVYVAACQHATDHGHLAWRSARDCRPHGRRWVVCSWRASRDAQLEEFLEGLVFTP